MKTELILASQSPRRRSILAAAGFHFETMVSPAVELKSATVPADLALENSRRKATAVAERRPEAIVLGADTIVELHGAILGKPSGMAEAEQFLERLSGSTHHVITGLSIISRNRGIDLGWAETTAVVFKPFDRRIITEYLHLVDVLDKAGAYAIQEHGEMLLDHFDGELNNIIGLPMVRLTAELARLGITPA